eukprot:TRINITY_DN20346_c0_g1_i1.p1 TRINITY_DN20346_c0_g1~~TRINITY_DN20346_c0_g1_i1.p1  ORF type:complete len:708 (+),score=135.17 TRINITY_DN20346_c0_g1_i1:111-2234(+)
MDDVGMQRAIWASIQSATAAPRPMPSYRPSPSYSRDIAPTQPRGAPAPRARCSESTQARAGGWPPAQRAAPAPSSRDFGARGQEPSLGRRNLLQREGVHAQASAAGGCRGSGSGAPRSPRRSYTATSRTAGGDFGPAPRPRPRAGTGAAAAAGPAAGEDPPLRSGGPRRPLGPGDGLNYMGRGPNLSRRGDLVHGWADVLPGGKLQRQNPSGSHLQVVCEDGWDLPDFSRLPGSHSLVSVTELPPDLADPEKQVTVSMTAKLQLHASKSLLFGVVLNYQERDGAAEFVVAGLSQIDTARMQVQAQVMRYVLRDKCDTAEAEAEVTHPAAVAVRVGQPLRLAVTRQGDRLELVVNGTKVFKNVAAGCPGSSRFGVCAVGTKAQVRDIQCNEGSAADLSADGDRGKIDPHFASIIEQDILDSSPNVQWEDIAALDEAKRLLNEAVVLPLIIPEFFTGLRTPWKGVLLFGPPGTGKTLLAKAVATCANTTFFNITASSLLSKWHGESEKMVRCLFQLARKHAPSTIFFDEIDALMMKRGGGNEHESSRRLKSELLSQIDGITCDGKSRIMVLATSNKPWDLDEAIRRRLEKRIYIPLPEREARAELFRINLKEITVDRDVRNDDLAARTEGYSGADIHQVCRDASMAPIRRVITGKSPAEIARMKQDGQLDSSNVVLLCDFVESIKRIQPSVAQSELQRYCQWEKDFASV